MKKYIINFYQDSPSQEVEEMKILADSKEDAYSQFLRLNDSAYGAWVEKVVYKNGNVKYFNTFCGKPV